MKVVRRVLAAVLSGLGVLLVVVLSLVLQLNVPVVRRVVTKEVNELLLGQLFKGKIIIDKLGHLDAGGVGETDARIVDENGKTLIVAEGLHARIDIVRLLATLAFGHGNIVVDLSDVRIRHAEVVLDADDTGVAIANAFLPKHPSTKPKGPPSPGSPKVFIPRIHIDHAWGHGQMPGIPYFDDQLTAFDGSFSFAEDRVTVDAKRGQATSRGIALGHDAAGAFSGHFEILTGKTLEMGLRFKWDGSVGDLHETAEAAVEHGHFDAKLDVIGATPEAIQSLWPASPITTPGSVHVEAHGPLDKIDVAVHGELLPATVDVQGQASWGDDKRAKVHLDVDAIDLQQLTAAVGPTKLGVVGDVDIGLRASGRIEGGAKLEVRAGHIQSIQIPRTTLETTGFRDPDGSFGGDAVLDIDEPGAPTKVTLHATPKGHASRVEFTVDTHAVRLGLVRRLLHEATGSAEVTAKGVLDLADESVEASVDTHGASLEHGALHVGTLAVKAHAHGSLDNPEIVVDLHAAALTVGEYAFEDANVSARGRALTPHVTFSEHSMQLPSVEGQVDVNLLGGPSFGAVDLWVSHAGERAHVLARRLRVSRGHVNADDIEVTGLGAPIAGSFEMVGEKLRLVGTAPRVEVHRIARFVDLGETLKEGVVSFDADVALESGKAEGRAKVGVSGLCVGNIDGVDAQVDATLKGREFAGTIDVKAADFGTASIQTSRLEIGGGGALDKASWWKAWGDIGVKAHVDLAKAFARLPEGTLPVGAVKGVLDVDGRLGRDSAHDFTPRMEVTARTTGLIVAGKAPKPTPREAPGTLHPPPWTLQGIDVTTSIHGNGDTGAVSVHTHLADAKGELAVVKVGSKAIPWESLYDKPGEAMTTLEHTDFDASVSLPPRDLANWPPWLVQRQLGGTLQADLAVHGSVFAPSVELTALVHDAVPGAARLTSPLDLSMHLAYDGTHARVSLTGVEREHELLTAVVDARVLAEDLLAGRLGDTWNGAAKVHVDEFPLVTVGFLDDRQVRGRLSGDISVDGLHENGRAAASLTVAGLRVGDVAYKTANVTLAADGKEVRGQVWLEQNDGLAYAKVHVGASWGTALLPKADPNSALDVDISARRFRAATLLPFIQGVADELDGRIDADAHLSFDPRSGGGKASGSLQLTDGLIEVGAFGGEFHDISAKLTLAPDGVLTLENATASGVSGRLMASASARLHGLALTSASAVIEIPKKAPLPLSINGAQLATLDGSIKLTEGLSADHRTVELKVDIASLHALLPEVGAQDVQTLGPIAGVSIGSRKTPDGEFVVTSLDPEEDRAPPTETRPEDAMRVQVKVHLGDDVTVRRGTDLHAGVTGDLTVLLTDKTHMSGQLRLHDGALDLYGKAFEIESGSVLTFIDDPSNPQANVRASWNAPDGTHVTAEFVGPLKSGKVNLVSDAGLTKNEIIQLILFGSDPTQGQASSATPAPGQSSAEGFAGAAPAQALNHALGQIGLSRVSAKIDTSQTVAKPEVEVQIARDISIKLAVFAGTPPPGSNPDTTFLSIDWHIVKKLSLESTVGNVGSTIVDMIWRYRY